MDRASRRAVLQRLTALDPQAGSTPPPPVARSQLRRIVEGWRDILSGHQPDSRGRCPKCSGPLRRRKWPCQVWVTAHHQLVGEGQSDGRSDEHRAAPRDPARPTRIEIVARAAGDRRYEPERATTRVQPHPVLPALLQVGDSRIHRASVVERRPTMPRPRRHRGSQA